MNSSSGARRSFLRGPWRYCGVRDTKEKISTMQWQRGTLKSQKAIDTWPLPGQREAAIAQVLTDGREENELAPVEKLRNPTEFEEAEDFIL